MEANNKCRARWLKHPVFVVVYSSAYVPYLEQGRSRRDVGIGALFGIF